MKLSHESQSATQQDRACFYFEGSCWLYGILQSISVCATHISVSSQIRRVGANYSLALLMYERVEKPRARSSTRGEFSQAGAGNEQRQTEAHLASD